MTASRVLGVRLFTNGNKVSEIRAFIRNRAPGTVRLHSSHSGDSSIRGRLTSKEDSHGVVGTSNSAGNGRYYRGGPSRGYRGQRTEHHHQDARHLRTSRAGESLRRAGGQAVPRQARATALANPLTRVRPELIECCSRGAAPTEVSVAPLYSRTRKARRPSRRRPGSSRSDDGSGDRRCRSGSPVRSSPPVPVPVPSQSVGDRA